MIDLHMHSRYSENGEYTPAELVEQCLAQGIRVMSITDHNCARANMEAQDLAEKSGIIYISGIEIDCICQGMNICVLGYGMDLHNKDFDLIEQNIEKQSFQASIERLEATQTLGLHVTENDMWNISKDCYWQGTWTGDMFAQVLLQKQEYTNHPLLRPYRFGGSRSDNPYANFCWDFYSQGKICYVKMEYPTVDEIVDTIHRNKGIAVLANPVVNIKDKGFLLDEILRKGMDGIKVFSSLPYI